MLNQASFISYRKKFLLLFLVQSWQLLYSNDSYLMAQPPSLVYYDQSGRLNYLSNQEGNRIPDFSHAGYRNGEEVIPTVQTVIELEPIEGDNSVHIQNAIDSIGKLPMNAEGIRGAVTLLPGTFDVYGNITISKSGVVLRGSTEVGNDSVVSTIRAFGEEPETVLTAGGNVKDRWLSEVVGSRQNITSEYLPVGSRSIVVEDASIFEIGDNIIIVHPSSDAWLASIDYGGTDTDDPWSPNTIDIIYNRYVKAIDQNKITIDVPIYENFNRSLSQAYVFKYDRDQLKTNIGIENLNIVIQTAGELTENHFRTGIDLIHLEDSWVRNVSVKHFSFAAIDMTDASRITVDNCKGLEPHSEITGGRRYNFCTSRAVNNVLFKHCLASNGRHDFVSNGISMVSGVVFLDCISEATNSTSEGHRRWSQGLLFDNITFIDPDTRNVIGLYNRGSYGTGHGWSSSHSVAWNIDAGGKGIAVQKPPTSQNYTIGCKNTYYDKAPFNKPQGYIEEVELTAQYRSLYEMQLKDRMEYGVPPDAPAKLKIDNATRTLYWLDIAASESAYIIERSEDYGETYKEIGQVGSNVTSYQDGNAQFNKTYFYRVRAENENGKSAYSNPVELALVTSLEINVEEELVCYPVPASDKLYIQFPNPIIEISVFDSMGKNICNCSEDTLSQNFISIKNFRSGLYFIKILAKNGKSYSKFFIKT